MRVTVRDVLEYLAGVITVPELLADFLELTAEDVQACLDSAASLPPRPAPSDFLFPTEHLHRNERLLYYVNRGIISVSTTFHHDIGGGSEHATD